MRTAVSLELFENCDYYAHHPHFKILEKKVTSRNAEGIFKLAFPDDVDQANIVDRAEMVKLEAKLNLKSRRFSCLMDILALSSVIGREIDLIYPSPDKQNIYRIINNGKIEPRLKPISSSKQISLMWSTISTLGSFGVGSFKPNHFLPIIEEPCIVEPPTKKFKTDSSTKGLFFY